MLQRREVKTPSRNFYCPNYQNCLTRSVNANSTGFECPRNCAHLGECEPPDAEEPLRAGILLGAIFHPDFPKSTTIASCCPRCGKRFKRRCGPMGAAARRFCNDCHVRVNYLDLDPSPAALRESNRHRWPAPPMPSELTGTRPEMPLERPTVAPAAHAEGLPAAIGSGGIR